MTVVVNFDRRVDAQLDRLFNHRTIPARDPQCDILPGRDFIRKADDVGDLCSVETETLSGDAIGELERREPIPTRLERWIRSKLWATTAFTPRSFVPFGSPIAAGTGAGTPVRRR